MSEINDPGAAAISKMAEAGEDMSGAAASSSVATGAQDAEAGAIIGTNGRRGIITTNGSLQKSTMLKGVKVKSIGQLQR